MTERAEGKRMGEMQMRCEDCEFNHFTPVTVLNPGAIDFIVTFRHLKLGLTFHIT